jgi:ABC-2 type transport system ATP-binding protein
VAVISRLGLDAVLYRRTWALRDCCLPVPEGCAPALVGPDGSGKTTLASVHLAAVVPLPIR